MKNDSIQRAGSRSLIRLGMLPLFSFAPVEVLFCGACAERMILPVEDE